MIMVLFDYICVMNYPDVLNTTDRNDFQEMVPQDMDDLRQQLETQISEMQGEILEEEEKLKAREEELGRVQVDLQEMQEKYLEEEETLLRKEEELNQLESDLKVKSEEFLVEEEEKLKTREEELIKLQEESEVKSKLYEESQELILEKEQELEKLKSQLEGEIRKRIEEEEKQRLKDAADDMMRTAKASRILYPFSAIVGQETMRLSLILNAINPSIGGVLILGQKGTAKSVAVRGLSEILPDIEIVDGCKFNCDPEEFDTMCTECKAKHKVGKFHLLQRPIRVVDLPLNITEDRLVGSIDIEKILGGGVKAFEPGLLAEAHRGVLYVDEINLLDDFIVDLLLDAAAMGINTVEREGLHISHPAEFIIIGSMNPEEGELRPQLIDRLGLQVRVEGIKEVSERIQIVEHRKEFVEDAISFRKKFEDDQQTLRDKITKAKDILEQIVTPPHLLKIIARLCMEFDVHGHRADIIIDRAARTHAALEGRLETNIEDVVAGAQMALPHRMRKMPLEEEEFNPDMLHRLVRSYEFGE
jgi:magnesium chelatase subunit I